MSISKWIDHYSGNFEVRNNLRNLVEFAHEKGLAEELTAFFASMMEHYEDGKELTEYEFLMRVKKSFREKGFDDGLI